MRAKSGFGAKLPLTRRCRNAPFLKSNLYGGDASRNSEPSGSTTQVSKLKRIDRNGNLAVRGLLRSESYFFCRFDIAHGGRNPATAAAGHVRNLGAPGVLVEFRSGGAAV